MTQRYRGCFSTSSLHFGELTNTNVCLASTYFCQCWLCSLPEPCIPFLSVANGMLSLQRGTPLLQQPASLNSLPLPPLYPRYYVDLAPMIFLSSGLRPGDLKFLRSGMPCRQHMLSKKPRNKIAHCGRLPFNRRLKRITLSFSPLRVFRETTSTSPLPFTLASFSVTEPRDGETCTPGPFCVQQYRSMERIGPWGEELRPIRLRAAGKSLNIFLSFFFLLGQASANIHQAARAHN